MVSKKSPSVALEELQKDPRAVVASVGDAHVRYIVDGDEEVGAIVPAAFAREMERRQALSSVLEQKAIAERQHERIQATRDQRRPAGLSLRGRFPQLRAIKDADLEEAQHTWDEGAEKQLRIITEAPHE